MIELEDIKRSQLLEAILDSSPNCIYVKDKQGRYILANKTIADLYRTTPDKMIGKKDEDFADQAILTPNEAEFFKDVDRKAIETKETQTIPCESFTYDDGTTHYFFTTKTPIIYQDDPDCVLGISVDITKLKETEKQASENESKFKDIFNKSTMGYALTKPDGTLSEVNKAFASMLGYTVEELSQMNFEDITHPEDLAESKECVKCLLFGTKDSYRLEKRYFHKHGSIVWTDVSTTIMKDNAGNPLFFITAIQDITEKKDSLEKLKQSEKKFKTLFNSSSDALFIHSLADEKIIDVNDETLRRYGYTKNEILDLTIDDLSDTSINSTKSKETQQFYQNLLDGETIQTKWCSKKKNGETFWHLMTLKIVTIDGEKRILAQAKDIDEMVNSRNKLAESEKKYRRYIDNAPNGVFICDEHGRYLEVNDKAVETTGYSKEELLTMSINDMISDENKELGLHHFQTLLKEGKSFGEVPFIHRDGTVRWWQVNSVKLSETRFLGFTQDITEKIEMEQKLQRIFNMSSEFICEADINTATFTKINPTFINVLGYSEEELLAHSFLEFIHPDDIEPTQAVIDEQLQRGKKVLSFINRYRCKDGSYVWLDWNSHPVSEKGFLYAIARDITDDKIKEKEIIQSKKETEMILNTAADGIRIVTKDFKIKTMNDTIVEMTNTTKADGIGQYCFDVFKSNNCGTENCSMVKILRTGKGFEEDEIRISSDGRKIPCISKITPYKDENNEIVGIIEDFRDITSLLETEAKFQNIFENKGTAMGMFGDDGVITLCNSKFEEISGFRKMEINGKMKWSDFVVKEDLERMMKYHRQRSEGGNPPSEYVCDVINKQGERKTMIVNIGVMPNSKERIVSLTDITKQKIAENKLLNAHNELKDLNQKLEQKVKDRTQQIQILLNQKDEFINQLGHDIKNPLGPLVNLLPILENKVTDPKQKNMIHVMNRNVSYIKNLVTRTIRLAQLNSPSTGLKYEEFDLGKEIHDIIENHQLHFDKKQITVENNIPENMMISADILKMQEVFNNLLNNAVKYNKKDGAIIIEHGVENDTLTISIKDTGIGMTSEQLKRVFDEFFKADSSRHDFDSSGLGMAITKRIIELHGGKIWAESEGLDKGSTFYFTVPLRKKDD